MNEIFSRNLRNALYLAGMTQAELARAVATSETSVSNWINGNVVPRPKMVDKICTALRCKRDDLMVDKTQKILIAPEDILAEEMQNRPDLYRLFSIVMQMPSKDVELMLKLAERLSL